MTVSSEEEQDFHSSCELWAVWRTEVSKGRFHGDIIATSQYLKAACRGAREGLFTRNCRDGIKSKAHKLKEGDLY